jgi:hypothetical protein
VKTALNPISTQRVRKAKAALVAAAALAGSIFAGSAHASDITLTDGNNTVTINPGAQTGAPGLNSWVINGVNQLTQEWYYFSVGNSSGPSGLDALNTATTPVAVTLSDSRGLPGVDNTAKLAYTDPAGRFTATASYQLTGAFDDPPTKGDITETLKITNTSSSTLNFHLYEYTNLQVAGTVPNDSLSIFGGDSAIQSDPTGVYATVTASPTHHSEAALASTLSTALAGPSPLTLNDDPTITNADAALAYEWDLSIPVGQSVIIGTDKSINSESAIPEPSPSIALAGVAAAMLARRRTRRPLA